MPDHWISRPFFLALERGYMGKSGLRYNDINWEISNPTPPYIKVEGVYDGKKHHVAFKENDKYSNAVMTRTAKKVILEKFNDDRNR